MVKKAVVFIFMGILFPVLSYTHTPSVQGITQKIMTVKDRMDALVKEFDIDFVYDSSMSLDIPYTGGDISGLGLEDALDRVFADTGITWKMQRRYIVLTYSPPAELEDSIGDRMPHSESDAEQADTLSESRVTADLFRRNSTQTGLMRLTADRFNQGFAFMSTPDIIKTIQTLPGVSSGTELLSGLFVHGGTGTDNLFLLDGVPIYQISHFGGLFSSFNSDVVESLDFYKSGFPARYGGRLSSVVDVTMRDGDMDSYHGIFSIGLIDGRIQLEGPIVKGKTSFNIAMRRSWIDAIMIPANAIMNRSHPDDRNTTAYSFYDINAKLTHRFSPANTLSLSFYNGRDGLKLKKETWSDFKDADGNPLEDTSSSRFRWGNIMTSLDWEYRIRPEMKSNVVLYYTRSTGMTDNLLGNWSSETLKVDFSQKNRSVVNDFGLRSDFEWLPGKVHYIRYGAGYQYHMYVPSMEYSKYMNVEGDALEKGGSSDLYYGHEASVYAEDEISVTRWFKTNVGLRYTLFGVPDKVWHGLEPRAAFKFQILPALSTRVSYTRMHQFNHNIASTYIDLPTNIWLPSTSKTRPMVSDQIAAGIYTSLPHDISLNVEGFYKTMDNILEYNGLNSLYPPIDSWDKSFVAGKGRSYGAEVELNYRTDAMEIAAYYTLSWSERKFDDFYPEWYPDRNDNRHKLTVMATRRFKKGIELYMAWNYHSGNRMTVPEQVIETERMTVTGLRTEKQLIFGKPNNAILPDYHRLDLGMNIRKKTRKGHENVWNVSIYNAYCRMNAVFVSIDTSGEKVQAKATGIFPILPSFSYTFRF